MMNTANGTMMSPSSSSVTAQSPGLKTYFKTPEGRYKLHYEKTHPSGLLHYAHGKTVTQVTLAHLKDKPAPSTPTASSSSSSFSASSGVRSAAARLLGGSNGSRALSFVGGNGGSKSNGGNTRIGSIGASSTSSAMANPNFDGKGTYLIFNVGDAIFISDLNSQDKDPIKSIHFSNSNPVCHAFDQDAKDGHDLLIGLNSGDVYSVSLRQQLQDVGKKPVGALHYNRDGSVNNRQDLITQPIGCQSNPAAWLAQKELRIEPNMSTWCSHRCTCIAWVPGGDGSFVVSHADGNLYNKDGAGDSSFPVVKDQTQFSVAHARYSKVSGVAFDSYWSSPNSNDNGETIMYRFGSVGQESVLTACREGHIKIWMRPGVAESQSSTSENLLATNLKEKPSLSSKISSNSSYKQ
ncbi:hypothetical protein JHK86_053825 [Glycine max]|nr:hypothetical protein JHK86_053825 [Glycine max]